MLGVTNTDISTSPNIQSSSSNVICAPRQPVFSDVPKDLHQPRIALADKRTAKYFDSLVVAVGDQKARVGDFEGWEVGQEAAFAASCPIVPSTGRPLPIRHRDPLPAQ
jgi:hypothetical protein